ncbi:hypothetical protein [Priestia aryabhattai]|uniref:hypothetical protein n=1 Tax=Priestia aryabhattai TaxID=412384 RepID=UPI002E1B92ED|nr:hypothetical protein [Priestia aryabhattai]
MKTEITSALIGLGGVIVGAFVPVAVQMLQQGFQSKEKRKEKYEGFARSMLQTIIPIHIMCLKDLEMMQYEDDVEDVDFERNRDYYETIKENLKDSTLRMKEEISKISPLSMIEDIRNINLINSRMITFSRKLAYKTSYRHFSAQADLKELIPMFVKNSEAQLLEIEQAIKKEYV